MCDTHNIQHYQETQHYRHEFVFIPVYTIFNLECTLLGLCLDKEDNGSQWEKKEDCNDFPSAFICLPAFSRHKHDDELSL